MTTWLGGVGLAVGVAVAVSGLACGSLLSLDDPPAVAAAPDAAGNGEDAAPSPTPPAADGGFVPADAGDAESGPPPCGTILDGFEGFPADLGARGWSSSVLQDLATAIRDSNRHTASGAYGLHFLVPATGGRAYLFADFPGCVELRERRVSLALMPLVTTATPVPLLRLRRGDSDTLAVLTLRAIGLDLELAEAGKTGARLTGLVQDQFVAVGITIDRAMNVAVLSVGGATGSADITGGLGLRGVDLGILEPPASEPYAVVVDDFALR